MEDMEEVLDSIGGSKDYGYPKSPTKDSVFKFFRDILDLNDSSKAANLDEHELGKLKLAVRHYQDLANYAEMEGIDTLRDYFIRKSEIILSTSLSRKGFLAQLFVTQIKREQKIKKPSEQKKNWYGKKIEGEGVE